MGLKFGATDASKFEYIVSEKEQSVAKLRQSLPEFISKVQSLADTSQERSKILYYKGIEGYKQVTYNSTKAKGVLRIIERVNDMSVILPRSISSTELQPHIV